MSLVVLVLLLAACGSLGAPPTGGPGAPTEDPGAAVVAQALLDRVNAVRASGTVCGGRGTFVPAAPLRLDARLVAAAQGHSEDMQARGVMSHVGGDGSDPGDRIARTGYVASGWGENVAAGYPTVDAVMAGWLGSDGHCANLMNPRFRDFGGGVAATYWTQVFARP